jgi:hypothetical protein
VIIIDTMMNKLPLTFNQKTPPDHIGVMISAIVMIVGGWGGLYQLVSNALPRVENIWVFFALLHIAITGTALPFVRYLSVRFTPVDIDLPPGGVLVRRAVWIGTFVVTCAWLQMPRVLNWPIAFFLGLMFIVIEVFLRSREISLEYDE